MFIREILKKYRHSKNKYAYHRLVESYRTHKDPRHRTLLNFGTLKLSKGEWKDLANRIEEITKGLKRLYPVSEEVAQLAESMIRKSDIIDSEINAEYHNVDISSIKNENLRSIGAEYACTEQGRSVVHSFYEKIGLNQILKELGMSLQDRQIAEILVDSRLIAPGSEKHAFERMNERSGINDLLGFQKGKFGLSSFYRVMDKIYGHKDEIEERLAEKHCVKKWQHTA